MSTLILCFSEIPEICICICVRQVVFFILVWKKLFVWSSILFTVFTLEMRKREAFKKQTGSNMSVLLYKVSVLEHDRFMQVLHAVSWIFANT